MASWLPKIHIPLRCTPVIHETERQWALFTVFYSGHILFPPSSTSSPSLYVEDSTSSPTTKAKYDFYLGSPPLVPDCLPYRSIKPCPSSILTVLSVTCSLSMSFMRAQGLTHSFSMYMCWLNEWLCAEHWGGPVCLTVTEAHAHDVQLIVLIQVFFLLWLCCYSNSD